MNVNKSKIIFKTLRFYFTGFVMGMADLVPGVSGGTIAFVFGIYENLLAFIKTITGIVPRSLVAFNFRRAYQEIPFGFIVPLGLGLLTAVFGLAPTFVWLWQTQPILIKSFFFGLVLASIVVVLRRVQRWRISYLPLFILSLISAYYFVGIIPIETPTDNLTIFLSGLIAFSVMILPGISGSFVLLLLGKYEFILRAVAERDLFVLVVFISGGIIGLAFFVRGLLWLLRHYHDLVIVILAGLMSGSIRKIWPGQGLREFSISNNNLIYYALLLFILGILLTWLGEWAYSRSRG